MGHRERSPPIGESGFYAILSVVSVPEEHMLPDMPPSGAYGHGLRAPCDNERKPMVGGNGHAVSTVGGHMPVRWAKYALAQAAARGSPSTKPDPEQPFDTIGLAKYIITL